MKAYLCSTCEEICEPEFVILAKDFEDAARQLGGRLTKKERVGVRLIGKIFIPKERFTRPPTKEELGSPYFFSEDSLVYDLNGFALEMLAEEIEESKKGYLIGVRELPLAEPSSSNSHPSKEEGD